MTKQEDGATNADPSVFDAAPETVKNKSFLPFTPTTKMAANQLRAMHGRIDFNDGADDNIIDAQGIDSVRELGCLNNDDTSNLCRMIDRPGGMSPIQRPQLEGLRPLGSHVQESWFRSTQRDTLLLPWEK